jgi:NAD(P)-dependent dehydrogenase (short-subunit alcohol dehydrogenase family)
MSMSRKRVAVVTGASRGVGKGIALALGEAGATVYVTGRSDADGTTEGISGTVGDTANALTHCTSSDYRPTCVNTFLHHQGRINARIPVPGFLRRYSGGRPALSLKLAE